MRYWTRLRTTFGIWAGRWKRSRSMVDKLELMWQNSLRGDCYSGDRKGGLSNRVESVAGYCSFSADGSRGGGFALGSAAVPAATSILGADYNARHYAVLAGRGALGLLAAFCGDCTGGATRRACDDLLRAARTCFRRLRVSVGAAQRSRPFGSKRLSVRRHYAGDRALSAAHGTRDILSKVTYDREFSGRHFHAEAVGLVTGAHASVKPVGQDSFKQHSAVGGGGDFAANYELLPKLVLLGNIFCSDGGAHYLVATGPQLVVRPNLAGTDISLSMVHAGAASAGLEWRATEKEAFAVYYGADYFGRNFFPDTTNTAEPGTIIGYGGPGSPNTNNRAIQQATFDWLNTFWKDTRYGALQSYIQYSYLTRAPWFIAPDTPKNAHLSMVYFGLRYILPSTSGTLLRVPYPN